MSSSSKRSRTVSSDDDDENYPVLGGSNPFKDVKEWNRNRKEIPSSRLANEDQYGKAMERKRR